MQGLSNSVFILHSTRTKCSLCSQISCLSMNVGWLQPLVSHNMQWYILAGIPVSSCWLTPKAPAAGRFYLWRSKEVDKLDLNLAYSVLGLGQYETMAAKCQFPHFWQYEFCFFRPPLPPPKKRNGQILLTFFLLLLQEIFVPFLDSWPREVWWGKKL